MEENDVDALVEKALKSFLCFLYVGKEVPLYKAKPWNDDDYYFGGERLRSLEILASNKKTELTPIDKIKLAMDSSLIQRPETLMFALAMCARQKKSEKLRAAAYYFVAEHCKDWKYFILFIKYASYLCKIDGTSKNDKEGANDEKGANDKEGTNDEEGANDEAGANDKEGTNDKGGANNKKGASNRKTGGPIGWGRGWKNAVNKWYLNHSAWDLAILVGRHRGGHGWKHKDILKLSHIDTQGLDVEKQVVIKYVLNGLEATSKEYQSVPEAKKLLDYFKQVDDFRKCQDADIVADKLSHTSFTMDHVHPTALKNKKVWLALVSSMDVRTIIKNLQKMNSLRLFTKMSPATEIVIRALTEDASLRWNKVLPAEILEVLNLYESPPVMFHPFRETTDPEEATRTLLAEMKAFGFDEKIITSIKSKRSKTSKSKCTAAISKKTETEDKSDSEKTVWKPPPIRVPDMRIRDALRTALSIAQTVDITEMSKKSYLFLVRLPGMRRPNKCAEAALALALPLFHRNDSAEDAVTILAHERRLGIGSLADITKNTSYDDALCLLIEMKRKLYSTYNMPRGPWEWCSGKYPKYDVVINVTNEAPPEKEMKPLRSWHERLKTRIINVIVSHGNLELKGDTCYDVLTINGFDQHVPWIIEAYVRGLF